MSNGPNDEQCRESPQDVVLGTPPLVRAWDASRALVSRWENDNAYGRGSVNLTPKNRDDLVRRVALALLAPPSSRTAQTTESTGEK